MIRNILFLSVLLTLGCGSEGPPPPENLIREDAMVELLIEMHKKDAEKHWNRQWYPDSLRNDTVDYGIIFKSHGVSRSDYDSSMAYYTREPEVLDRIYDAVIEKLNKEKLDTETGK